MPISRGMVKLQWSHTPESQSAMTKNYTDNKRDWVNKHYIGKRWGQEKGVTEDKMVAWYHSLNGPDFEQTQGDSGGQGSLACCSSWGHRVRCDLPTEQQPSPKTNTGLRPRYVFKWKKQKASSRTRYQLHMIFEFSYVPNQVLYFCRLQILIIYELFIPKPTFLQLLILKI